MESGHFRVHKIPPLNPILSLLNPSTPSPPTYLTSIHVFSIKILYESVTSPVRATHL